MKEQQDCVIQPIGFSEGESSETAVPLVYRGLDPVLTNYVPSHYLNPLYQQQLADQQYHYAVWQNWVFQQRELYCQQLMQQQQSYQLSNYQSSLQSDSVFQTESAYIESGAADAGEDDDLASADIPDNILDFLIRLLSSELSDHSTFEVHQREQSTFRPVVVEDNQGKNLYISVAPGVRINIGEYALWNSGRQNMFLVEYPDETYGLASVDKLLDVDSGQPLADQDFDMYVIGVDTNFLEL